MARHSRSVMHRGSHSPKNAKSVTDVVASTSQLLADFSLLDNHAPHESSSTDSVQTPVGWAGGLLEQQSARPRNDTASRSSGFVRSERGGRSPTAGSPPSDSPPHRSRNNSKPSSRPGYRRLWNQFTATGVVNSDSSGEMTVEDLVALIQKLPGDVPVVPAVSEGLWTLVSCFKTSLMHTWQLLTFQLQRLISVAQRIPAEVHSLLSFGFHCLQAVCLACFVH